MPTVEFQGTLHEFPDTFTDAQIGRALKGVSLRGQQDAARNELLPRLAGLMPAPDAYAEPARPKFQPSSFADIAGENAMRPEGKLPRAPRITAQDAARAFDVLGAAAEFARQGAFNPNASAELDERMARDVTPGIPSKIAAGVQQTAAGLADPEAVALLAATAGLGALPMAAQRVASAGFAGWMAHHAGQQAADLEQAVKDDDVEAAAAATAGLGMSTLFAGLSAKHSLKDIAQNSPRIAGWLSKKVAVADIPPAEVKAAFNRLERGLGTEADANLVRMVNESSPRPGEAFRQGVTVEETSPRVGPAFREWLGVPEVTGGRTVRLRDGREAVVAEETGGTVFAPPSPLRGAGERGGERGLLGEGAAPTSQPSTPRLPTSPALRGEAAMETRPAAEMGLDRTRPSTLNPELSTDLADTIAALRAGYRPEMEGPATLAPAKSGAKGGQADMVTLYRGEGSPYSKEKFDSLPKHTRIYAGEWFTTSAKDAQNYANAYSGTVREIQVPKSELEQYRISETEEFRIPTTAQEKYRAASQPAPTPAASAPPATKAGTRTVAMLKRSDFKTDEDWVRAVEATEQWANDPSQFSDKGSPSLYKPWTGVLQVVPVASGGYAVEYAGLRVGFGKTEEAAIKAAEKTHREFHKAPLLLSPATKSAATTAPRTGSPSREEIGTRPGELTSQPAASETSALIGEAESARLDKVNEANTAAFVKLTENQKSQLAVELGIRPIKATDAGILGDTHPDDLSSAINKVTGNVKEAAKAAENAEAATVRQMMADAADEMAKAGTKRSAGDIKKELVARLEAALKAAPVQVGADGAKQRVLIGVPGDGVFALINKKSILQEILKRAKAMSTATGVADTGKARGTPVPAVNKRALTPAEIVKQLEEFESGDDARGSIQQVYADGSRALVTDAGTLVEVKGPFPAKNNPDALFPVATADQSFATAAGGASQPAKVSTEDLFRIGRLRMGLEWGDTVAYVDVFEGKDGQIYAEAKDKEQNIAGYGRPTTDRYLGRYNAESLEKLARFARKMGDESVTLTPSEWMVKAKPSAGKDGKGVEPPKDIKMAAGILQGGKWRAVTMRFGNEATVPPPEAAKVRQSGRSSSSASASPMTAGSPMVGSPPPMAGPPPLPHEEPAFSALPLGMPELVDLYKSLSAGQYPKVVQAIARLPWAAGVFRHNDSTGVARVELLAKLFKLLTPEEEAALLAQAREYAQTVAQPGDNLEELVRERYRNLLKTALEEAKRRGPVRAQQVLAHEIMHWIDWVPDHTLKRGNILGHIAAFKDSWLKHWLARDPSQPHGKPLTAYEKEKLRTEALKQMQKELGPMQEIIRTILVEEPIWEIAGVTPQDVKNLFGVMDMREQMPELYRWFAEQPQPVKVQIVKAAMKGLVDERLAALGTKKQVGTKTIEKTVRERVGREPTPEEVAAKFRILLRAEILKRNLVELETIKSELEATIAWYQGTPTMNPYFKTGIEMFAEAGSIWLNNPFALAQRAPTFHAALVNWLGHRPEVKKLYDQIQEDLRTGAHQDKRRVRLREMFKRGDEKGMERRRNSMDKPQFLDGVRYELDRVFGPVYRRAKGTALEGSVYQAIGNFRYRHAHHELYLARENNEVGRLLAENALDWADFGELMIYRRIVEERYDLANPLGLDPKAALEGIAELQSELGPLRYSKLFEATEKFAALRQEMVVKPAVDTGYVSKEAGEKMLGNLVYGTFSVQRPMSEEGINRLLDMAYGPGIGPKIYRQMGTLQEIKNPATATVLKDLSLMAAVERNLAKREVVKLMREVDPELIREADQNWNGKRHEWVMKDTPHVGTVVVMNGGQPTAYYVPRTISDALNGADPMESQLAIAAIKANNTLKALYTQLNYGFWPVNLMRDTGSFWLQMPGVMSPVRWAKNLPRSWRAAVSSEKGTPNADAKEALRRLMLISRAEYRGLEAADEHELTLESFGQTPADWDRTAKQQHLLMRAWLKYKGLGQTLERLNKINGMLYLDEYFPNKPEWQKQKIVRELAGSPDFLERSGSAAVNWALMFYNPWKEGLHSLKAAAKADPWGFSFKTFALVMLPAVLQALAASGLLGDERKKLYRSIPDYDLSNYWCVPLGWENEAQGKVAYLRLPLAEPMRIMNGVIFHTLTQRGRGLTEYGAGQLPGLNSFAKVAMGWAALAFAGKNPHDTFRGKDVIEPDVFEAGGLPVAGEMGKWTWNELGGGIVYRFRDPQLTDAPTENVEKFLQLPVVSNVLGRWVKVSSRGIDDADRKLAEPVRQQRAQARVAVREMIRKFADKEPWLPEERALINKDAYAASYLSETLAKVLAQRESLPLRRWEKRESSAERGAVFAPQQ